MKNKKWLVIINYDCRLGESGEIVSRHSTIELAEKASKRTGYDSFLCIREEEEESVTFTA